MKEGTSGKENRGDLAAGDSADYLIGAVDDIDVAFLSHVAGIRLLVDHNGEPRRSTQCRQVDVVVMEAGKSRSSCQRRDLVDRPRRRCGLEAEGESDRSREPQSTPHGTILNLSRYKPKPRA